MLVETDDELANLIYGKWNTEKKDWIKNKDFYFDKLLTLFIHFFMLERGFLELSASSIIVSWFEEAGEIDQADYLEELNGLNDRYFVNPTTYSHGPRDGRIPGFEEERNMRLYFDTEWNRGFQNYYFGPKNFEYGSKIINVKVEPRMPSSVGWYEGDFPLLRGGGLQTTWVENPNYAENPEIVPAF